MLTTASLTLLAIFASVALTLVGAGSPLAVAHLVFAVGIVPLILAAMSHFVPVLTRTGEPSAGIRRLPFLAQLAGIIAVAAMQGWLPPALIAVAALADLLLAGFLLNWIAARSRAALGSPHPGWRWYALALGCLMMALLAILLTAVWPGYWRPLRLFHLHLNTLGLIGLAALGTLAVLLPTALGKPDPEAASWLRKRLWLVAGGAVVVATGAAIQWPFAVPGAALLVVAGMSLAWQWWRRFAWRDLLGDGVATSLLLAVFGLLIVLFAGVGHGAGLRDPRPDLWVWGIAFLLPLVSGALSQLLPVWRWPGPATPARSLMRRRLAAGGQWRAGCWLAAAIALLAGQNIAAAVLLGAGLLLFGASLLHAVRVSRSTR